MNGYTMVKIDNDTLLEMFNDRVSFWTDGTTAKLFEKMYENYIDEGCFDCAELNIMEIVDNDYVNWCRVVEEGEKEFNELLEVYKEQGIGDCSCEISWCGYIEAVDNEEDPTAFLIRF